MEILLVSPRRFLDLAATPTEGLPFEASSYQPSVDTLLMHISEASCNVSNWV